MTPASRVPIHLTRWTAALIAALLLLIAAAPLAASAATPGTLSLSSTKLTVDGTLVITYTTDEPSARNWIGIYNANQPAPGGGNASYSWLYAPGSSGTVTFDLTERRHGNGMYTGSFAAGSYRVEYLSNDGYTRLVPGESTPAFTVIERTEPAVTGTPAVGAQLSSTPGTWELDQPSLAYQWQAGGIDIPGATASTFTLTAAQLGQDVTSVVTATASGTTATQTSAPLSIPTSTVLLERTTTAPVGSLTVTYATQSPGARNWIGFYATSVGAPAGGNPAHAWLYAPGASGTITFDLTSRANGNATYGGAFANGTYRTEYLADDGYARLAQPTEASTLTVTAPPTAGGFDPGLPVPNPVAVPDLPTGTSAQKTLVIGLDGIRFDQVRLANTPNVQRIMDQGTTAVSYNFAPASNGAMPMGGTWSGPNWSSILTGVWPNKHGVTDNSFNGKRYDQYPDFLTRAEAEKPELTTVSATNWNPLGMEGGAGPVITNQIDYRYGIEAADPGNGGYLREDIRSADLVARLLYEDRPDVSFIYLTAPDAETGGNITSARYRASLESTDRNIGAMLRAIQESPSYANEDWRVVLVNDHSLTQGGGHGGGTTALERTVSTSFYDPKAAGKQRNDLRTVDIAATVLDRAGIAIDPAWGLDGTPVDQLTGDEFDTMRSALKPSVDESGVPDGMLGWTDQLPAGWRVDNSAMPAGGVTEWRGWTLTTNEFWSSPSDDRNRGRENFVWGRDVIAVADSAAWRGAGATGQFASTLITPRYDTLPGATVDLSFATQYQAGSGQRGEVSIVWSTGERQRLADYTTTTVSGVQALTATAPAGATGFEVQFAYTGSGDWFWALDRVTASSEGGTPPVVPTNPPTDPTTPPTTQPAAGGAPGKGDLASTGAEGPGLAVMFGAGILTLLGAAALVLHARARRADGSRH